MWVTGTAAKKAMVIDLAEYRLTRQLRSRRTATPAPPKVDLTWHKIGLIAQHMIDSRNGARAVIRDTRSDGGRYLWSVLGAGEMEPMAQGRTSDLEQARSIAEAALRAYAQSGWGGPVGSEPTPVKAVDLDVECAADHVYCVILALFGVITGMSCTRPIET